MPASASIGIHELLSSKWGQIGVVVLAATAFGVAAGSSPLYAAALVALMLAVVAMAAALVHPGRVFVGLVLLMALVPTYAAPAVGSLLFIPAAGAAWLLAGLLAWNNAMVKGYLFRPNFVDVAVGIFALLMAISLTFSPQVAFSDYLNYLFAWGGPYLAARLLLQETRKPVYLVAVSFALATVLLAPIALLETAGMSNPFLALQFNHAEAAVWANSTMRFGHVRAVTSFGHPIAFSMFLATSALLSLGMALNTQQAKHRYTWLAVAVLAGAAQALTYSRTGWFILAIGIALLILAIAKGAPRRRLAAVVAAVAAILVSLLLVHPPSQLRVLIGTGTSADAAAFQDSGAYREALLSRALRPGVLHIWGNPQNQVTPAVSSTNNATDNAYIIMADAWGLLPTAALIGVALMLLLAIVRVRLKKANSVVILPIVAFTGLAGLFFVAFITQQQVMIWLLIGAAGVTVDRLRQVSPSAVRRRSQSDGSSRTSYVQSR